MSQASISDDRIGWDVNNSPKHFTGVRRKSTGTLLRTHSIRTLVSSLRRPAVPQGDKPRLGKAGQKQAMPRLTVRSARNMNAAVKISDLHLINYVIPSVNDAVESMLSEYFLRSRCHPRRWLGTIGKTWNHAMVRTWVYTGISPPAAVSSSALGGHLLLALRTLDLATSFHFIND